MKSMKEIIIGQIENGIETISEIKAIRKSGIDYRLQKDHTDLTVNQLHPKALHLVVSEIHSLKSHAKTFRLRSKNGYLPPFQSGQYINLFAEIQGIVTSRPYSISSSNHQRAYYDVTVARIPGGFVSSYFLDQVKVGDELFANGPAGEFHFNPVFHKKDQVFIAGGSGITPFASIIKEVTSRGLDRKMHLIYGCRNEDSALFHEELIAIEKAHKNFKYTLVLSDEINNTVYRKGFIDSSCIKELVGNLSDKTFYICGPTIMNDFVSNALTDLKIQKRMIRKEMFGARQDIQNEPGWPSTYTGEEVFNIKLDDGRIIPGKSSESLLVALERSGVRVNVCCRSGECSFCRVKLVSGNVYMPRGVLLRHADEKFGYIHSCKAYPLTDIEIRF